MAASNLPINSMVLAFHFEVFIDGNSFSFQEVSGISAELKTTTKQPDGINREAYIFPEKTTYSNLVLKRGILNTQTVSDNQLLTWCNNTMLIPSKAKITTKNIIINLLNTHEQSIMGWSFIDCYPIKLNFGSLNSTKSEIAIETIEFTYKRFELIF